MDGNSGGTYIDIVEEFSSYHNSGCNDIGLTRVCTTTEVQYLLKYSNGFLYMWVYYILLKQSKWVAMW
jgi:hypothetical protein